MSTEMPKRSTIVDQLRTSANVPAELADIFREEAEEHLIQIYAALENLRSDSCNNDSLAKVRRSAHTLKGAAGAVGLIAATRLSHRMEDLLDHLVEQDANASPEQIRLLLKTSDTLQELTTGQFDVELQATAILHIYEQFECQVTTSDSKNYPISATAVTTDNPTPERQPLDLTNGETSQAEHSGEEAQRSVAETPRELKRNKETQRYLRVPLAKLDDMVATVGEMIVSRSAMDQTIRQVESKIDEILQVVQRTRVTSSDLNKKLESPNQHSSGGRPSWIRSNSVGKHQSQGLDTLEFDRYTDDHLLAQVISEGNNDVELVAQELEHLKSELESLFRRQKQLNRDAQNSLMQIRLVPLSSIANRLQRTVRTVSDKLDRSVSLEIVGDQTELDKTVMDSIFDPLQHLIRNAIDHGIEPTLNREAHGKPLESKITLEAINHGTQVTLRIADDGQGIDVEKVRDKALERELIDPFETYTDEELYNLIFLPGFSTTETLTDVSGRGVGMDIVRDTVASLKGSIRVESRRGQGTTFTIQLPTSVGIAQALLVESEGQTFAIPMQCVVRISRLELKNVKKSAGHLIVSIEGQELKLRELGAHLQLPQTTNSSAISQAPPILIVQDGKEQIAMMVGTILGGQEIVVKDFGDHLQNIPGLMGATVLGDGSIIPILDPVDLVGNGTTIYRKLDGELPASSNVRVSTAMVIDDSISVRRVTTNMLQNAGWDVVSARDGIDALSQLELMENTPDVILCDMEMPRMDGLELVKRLRRQTDFATVPIVMVTSRGSEKHRQLAFDAGVTDYVVKPFQEESILALIDEMVQEAMETIDG